MNLSEELAIAEAASPGPWVRREQREGETWPAICDFDGGATVFPAVNLDPSEMPEPSVDATFIAHARTVVPLALKVVEAAQKLKTVEERASMDDISAKARRDVDAAWTEFKAALKAFEEAS